MKGPEVKVVLRRPTLAAVMADCPAKCDGGFTHDPAVDLAVPCKVCSGSRAKVEAMSRAYLPAATFPACRGRRLDDRRRLRPPPQLRGADVEGWRVAQKALGRVAQYAWHMQRDPDGVDDVDALAVAYGGPGTGKTWLLANAICVAVLHGVGALYLAAADPFAALIGLGGTIAEGARLAERVPLLALDDVGDHRNDTAAGIVRDIIRRRSDELMPTIVGSGHPPASLERQLGASVADQLKAASSVLAHGSLRGAR